MRGGRESQENLKIYSEKYSKVTIYWILLDKEVIKSSAVNNKCLKNIINEKYFVGFFKKIYI